MKTCSVMAGSSSCCSNDKRSDPALERIGEADEIEAQRAQLLARGRVIGLRIGAGFAHAAEIEPARAFERRRHDELQNGGAALLDRADRPSAAQTDHGRIHEGRRMKAIDQDLSSRELPREIKGE